MLTTSTRVIRTSPLAKQCRRSVLVVTTIVTPETTTSFSTSPPAGNRLSHDSHQVKLRKELITSLKGPSAYAALTAIQRLRLESKLYKSFTTTLTPSTGQHGDRLPPATVKAKLGSFTTITSLAQPSQEASSSFTTRQHKFDCRIACHPCTPSFLYNETAQSKRGKQKSKQNWKTHQQR